MVAAEISQDHIFMDNKRCLLRLFQDACRL